MGKGGGGTLLRGLLEAGNTVKPCIYVESSVSQFSLRFNNFVPRSAWDFTLGYKKLQVTTAAAAAAVVQ